MTRAYLWTPYDRTLHMLAQGWRFGHAHESWYWDDPDVGHARYGVMMWRTG